jgi:hypothetical protein
MQLSQQKNNDNNEPLNLAFKDDENFINTLDENQWLF